MSTCHSCNRGHRSDYHSYNRWSGHHGRYNRHKRDRHHRHHSPPPSPPTNEVRQISFRLTGSEQVPPVATTMYGVCTILIPADNSYVEYELIVYNIDSPITGAHFHMALAGKNGPVVKNLNAFGKRMNVYVTRGRWTAADLQQPLTGELLQAMFQNKLYINVHTIQFPQGQIRGQVVVN